MKSTRLSYLFFLLTSTAALHAQSLIEQDCTIQIQSTGVKLLNWTGHVGRTYFIQSSPDLANWSWAPNIEAGENRPMSYEVDGPAKAGFFRLQYTDLTAPNLDSADFDSDGLTNLEEITQRPRPTGASLNQSLQTSSVMPVPMSTRQISSISTRATPSQNIQTNPLKADTDDDGLTDKWEEDHQLDPTDNGRINQNSGPNGDPDQDGLDNLSELQNGTNPMNEDTNGDGVSDSIGDGGHDIINVMQGELLNFRFFAAAPSGSPAQISNFKLLVANVPSDTASFVKLADGAFSVQWTATVPSEYPNKKLLQSVAVRDMTSQETMILGWVDVAEWEGMVAGIRMGDFTHGGANYQVRSHYSGKYLEPDWLVNSNADVWSCWYRGPKRMAILNEGGEATGDIAQITDSARYPFFIYSGTSSVPSLVDVSDPLAYPDKGTWCQNFLSAPVSVEVPASATISPGELKLVPFPAIDPRDSFNMVVNNASYQDSSGKHGIFETMTRYLDGGSGRSMHFLWFGKQNGRDTAGGKQIFLPLGATITPYRAGSLADPGLPLNLPSFPPSPYEPSLLPLQSEQWHQVVLKAGPEAGVAPDGLELKLGSGDTGDGAPQLGISIQVSSPSGLAPLAIPADGKIPLATGSDLYQRLISPKGLTIFIKRDPSVDQRHHLSLNLMPKANSRPTGQTFQCAALDLIPVELISDLSNDGQITAADNPLRDAALASGATDEIKDKGTEFLFHNDTLSNGIWDKEDTDPARPATEKDDDDAEEITIKPGISEGEVWLDHPAIAGLSFYKTRECKAADKVNLSPTSKFTVSASNPFPDKLFMRADGTLTYPDANPQFEGDLVLKIKVGTNGQEIEAVKMKLTVVKQLGAKKFFHASRDYIFERNTKLLVHDWKWPIVSPSTTIRMCVMREEATHMQPWESYHDDAYDNYVQSGSTAPFDPRTFTSCGLGIDGAANQDPQMTVVINGNQCDFTDPELPDPRTEIGRIARLATLTALSGSGEALLTDRCHGRVIISQVGPYGIRNPTSSDLDDPNLLAPGTSFRGSYLAGDDPILGAAIPGGKYISQSGDGKFEIQAGRVPGTVYPGPQNAMGGLSGSYGSGDRNDYPNSFVGYAPMIETGTTGKGVVFVAAGKGDDGMGKVKEFYDAAKASDVPLIPGATPSDGLPIIKLALLDSGKTSTALVHKNPAGNFHTVYKGSKHSGFPYYTNTFLRFKSTAPRQANP